MIKKIPNCDLFIDEQCNLFDAQQHPVHVPKLDFLAKLTIADRTQYWDLQFAMLLAMFEIPENVDPSNVVFIPQHHRNRKYDWRPKFRKPVRYYFDQEYRMVPFHSTIAVSKDGTVINLRTREFLVIGHSEERYSIVDIYDPILQQSSPALVHRLVASAWVYKDQDEAHPVVDHINENKHDNRAENLRWVTMLENFRHSEQKRLAVSADIGRVRNVFTGEVTPFRNMTEFCQITHAARIEKRQYGINFLLRKKFEVRFAGDTRPWFFTDPRVQNKEPGRFIYTVTNPDGEVKIYSGTSAFKKAFNISPNGHAEIDKVLVRFKERYPDLQLDVHDTQLAGRIQVLDIATNEISLYESREQVRNATGISVDNLTGALLSNGKRPVDGYCYRFESTEDWPQIRQPDRWHKIIATDRKTQEVQEFPGIVEASAALDIDRHVLLRMIHRPFASDKYSITRIQRTALSSEGENPS